jgi:hypothetical protein
MKVLGGLVTLGESSQSAGAVAKSAPRSRFCLPGQSPGTPAPTPRA